MNKVRPLATAALLLHGCATSYRVVPVENPPASVRYDRGAPTTNLTQRNGAVQVTPMPMNADGKLVFAVAAFNDSEYPGNFGVENVQVQTANKRLRIYTIDDLIREERNKAIAASVALAVLGVAAAAASQAAAHQTYRSSYSTPYGTYVYKASYYDAGQAAAGTALSIGAASAGIYHVNRTLDATIANMGQSILQTTTVDPGYSVGGRVLVQRPRGGDYPQEVTMIVNWMEETYPFRFEITKSDGRRAAPHTQPARSQASSPPAADESASVGDEAPAAPSSVSTAKAPVADRKATHQQEPAPAVVRSSSTSRSRSRTVRVSQQAPTTTVPENYLYEPSFLEHPQAP